MWRALVLLLPALVLAQPEWVETLREDFDRAAYDRGALRAIPPDGLGITYGPRLGGQAVHFRASGHNVGLATRRRFAAPFRLEYEFMQPAAESSGYRAVVTHAALEGQSFWLEFDKTTLAVWSDADGTWAPRWSADGFTPDTWYRFRVDNEADRVQVTVTDPAGHTVQSPWLPHDEVGDGSIEFRADTASTVRGAWFDNVRVTQPAGAEARALVAPVDAMLARAMADAPAWPSRGATWLRSGDRLALQLDQAGIGRAIKVHGRPLRSAAGGRCGGVWALDVAEGSGYHRFSADGSTAGHLRLSCAELGLRLEARVTPRSDRLRFEGEVIDTTARDRAVVLVWALPLDAEGWTWGDDLVQARPIAAAGRYHRAVRYPSSGRYGRHLYSIYPWAALSTPQQGLMVSRPLDQPRLAAFSYDHTVEQRFLGVRFEFGLSPATLNFPSRARFAFDLSALDQPAWGFRAAAQQYYRLYPESFVKRAEREGLWHLWVNPAVPQPEDFGLVFHEQEPYSEDRIAFDDKHGAYSLTYAEPAALWLETDAWTPAKEFDPAAFMAELRARAAQPPDKMTNYPFSTLPGGISDALLAQVMLNSYAGEEGQPVPTFMRANERQVVVACNGSLNLPQPNRASLWFEHEGQPALNDPRVDGAYLDSVGWHALDAVEDLRREHWLTATIPLVPSFRTGGPAQLSGFSHYQLYQAIAEAMHQRGKLTIANTFPFVHGLVAHEFDVLGAGEAANLDSFHDVQGLGFCRALAYHKPVSHMNYAYLLPKVPLAEKEQAIQRNLLYGIWPGFGNGGDVTHLEAVRPLYRRYIPLFQRLAAAGWEPITLARVEPEGVLAERYGRPDGPLYLVIHNSGDLGVTARLHVDAALRPPRLTEDLVSGERVRFAGHAAELALRAGQTVLLDLSRGK